MCQGDNHKHMVKHILILNHHHHHHITLHGHNYSLHHIHVHYYLLQHTWLDFTLADFLIYPVPATLGIKGVGWATRAQWAETKNICFNSSIFRYIIIHFIIIIIILTFSFFFLFMLSCMRHNTNISQQGWTCHHLAPIFLTYTCRGRRAVAGTPGLS